MSALKTFFFSPKKLGFHFLLAMGILIFICVVVFYILASYTRHGTEIVMPTFIGLDSKELLNKEDTSKDFIIEVFDFLYKKNSPIGIVLKQDPHVGEMVKKGRKVYVTVSSDKPPKVIMPQLLDVSLRQADIMLKAIGLVPGAVIYKPSPYENAVLEQFYKGRIIYPGTEINMGDTITLVVGKNPEDLPDNDENETIDI
ncbi:MAG: hypothetical protein LBU83_13140 [Bacteroidales bacterium]|jgi:beta-lactam-binding protein with PASTA domain|nr:hypothetical protein [Bacteroidales bacterium]